MQAFAVRLNPDPREGLPYSKYPTTAEYTKIHNLSPMDGFHEAVNFLAENGIVKGYLPPLHLIKMRTGEPFILITVTAKTARKGGDMIAGIQIGCRYEDPKIRPTTNSTAKKLQLTWHYSCAESMSLALSNQVNDARNIILNDEKKWGQGPTLELDNQALQRALAAIDKSITCKKERKKFEKIYNAIKNSKPIEKIIDPIDWDAEITKALKTEPSHKPGTKHPKKIEVITYQYKRNLQVIKYALEKAKGICGDCGKHAPFKSSKTNQPYLEIHHIKMLRDGGSDTIDNVIALCPNCHRKRHYG